MTKMIVAMDYTQDGTRTISELQFGWENFDILMNTAHALTALHDEVYIVDFDPNSQDFINAIVTHGCLIKN